MRKVLSPILVAITGGSGAGKTWLAEKLAALFGADATRLSLDSFYRDRSYLPPKRREQVNYDHPRAIDWASLEQCLRDCRAGRCARVPVYDFKTHARSGTGALVPKAVVIVEGLWLLRRPSLRQFFDLTVFIDCPTRLRLNRRMQRDLAERGRTPESIRRQFRETVGPMHQRFIATQSRFADIVLKQPLSEKTVLALGKRLERICGIGGETLAGKAPAGGARATVPGAIS